MNNAEEKSALTENEGIIASDTTVDVLLLYSSMTEK